ncbi:MAG: chorismate synthase [Candidatus Omnitrophota bacterium]
MLRFLTAGESHGRCVVAILEGMVAGLKVETAQINSELKRRQQGYGRGERMKIEEDKAEILSGVRRGLTLGSPICVKIDNKDFQIGAEIADKLTAITAARPGHADLAGVLKYGFNDIRNVWERASARETVCRVAVGAICKIFLDEFNIDITSRVLSVAGRSGEKDIKEAIDAAGKDKDTVGGIFEVIARRVPVGLGSYVHYDRRIDGCIAGNLMSVPGIKSVEFGLGTGFAKERGSSVQDVITYDSKKGILRRSNNAGGVEGGMTNGEPLVVRCAIKPISTLANPLDTVDIVTKKPAKAVVVRSDTCVVWAAGVIAESGVAFELAKAMLEKFGGDSLKETKRNFRQS